MADSAEYSITKSKELDWLRGALNRDYYHPYINASPPEIRTSIIALRKKIFEAYLDCIEAGLKQKADELIRDYTCRRQDIGKKRYEMLRYADGVVARADNEINKKPVGEGKSVLYALPTGATWD